MERKKKMKLLLISKVNLALLHFSITRKDRKHTYIYTDIHIQYIYTYIHKDTMNIVFPYHLPDWRTYGIDVVQSQFIWGLNARWSILFLTFQMPRPTSVNPVHKHCIVFYIGMLLLLYHISLLISSDWLGLEAGII